MLKDYSEEYYNLINEEDEFLIHCSCGKSYYVDPATEENLVRKRNISNRVVLITKCPFCGKKEK